MLKLAECNSNNSERLFAFLLGNFMEIYVPISNHPYLCCSINWKNVILPSFSLSSEG